MERIKQAVEKAKNQREGQLVQLNPTPAHLAGYPALVEGALPAGGALDNEVHYRQTAVVELDETLLEQERIVAHRKSHPASRSFDLLRTQVLQKMAEKGWRTLAVTSPTTESGKTVVAINLAIGIAQQTNRTSLLVDLDLRRPRVASSLGLKRAVSLNQVLSGQAKVEEALVNPGMARFVVLPVQQPVPNSSEVLASSRVASLIGELRDKYTDRVVIVDLPPVLAADDVLAILPRIDCVLMVVGNGTSTRKEIEESMTRLAKFNILGVVLNKDDAPFSKDYY
jgi:protein-tyrosine kinase